MKTLILRTINRRTIIYLLMCFTFLFVDIGLYAQNVITATGQVLEKGTGEPMVGVTVQEKGTSNGIITDIDGNYAIKVKQGVTLVFTSVGWKKTEIIAKPGKVTVSMEEDSKILEEVVVVGYGMQKKSQSDGSRCINRCG